VARKHLLENLVGTKLPGGNSEGGSAEETSAALTSPRFGALGSRGAIGAVTRSIEGLKTAASEAEQMRSQLASGQTVIDLEPTLLDPSPVADRIPDAGADHSALVESIRASGQQVPILIRPHPEVAGRYQIAYGHRRVQAARELRRPVRAVVRQLTDAELVVAQGQENNERRDLSFIERAAYAARLEEAGFEREIIMTALSTDKTGLSRLISAAVKIPRDVIEAIGPAPKIGRDRWIDLAGKIEPANALTAVYGEMKSPGFQSADTDGRFEIVLKVVQVSRPKPSKSAGTAVTAEGKEIAWIERTRKGARLQLNDAAFAEFLAAKLPRLHAEWNAAGARDREKGGASRRKTNV